jgi:hypothetical protein
MLHSICAISGCTGRRLLRGCRLVHGLMVVYLCAVFVSAGGAGAQDPKLSFTPAWQPFRLGAGGQITAIYTYPDSTTLIRADTYGGYLYVPSGTCSYGATVYSGPCWQNLINARSIPRLTIDMANGDGGAAELVACSGNTNVLYMIWQHNVYVSINKGANWVKTSQVSEIGANNGNGSGPFIACDPNNVDVVYVGTPSNGVFKSTNGTAGASNGRSIAAFNPVVGAGTSSPANANVIAFQPGSSAHILIGTYGQGFYETIDEGARWNLIPGSPTTFSHIVADQFNQFWITDNGGSNLYWYASHTVTKIVPGGGVASVAVDPNSVSVGTNHVAVTAFDGQLNISGDNGRTWTGHYVDQTFSASANQPPWLGNANQHGGGGPIHLNGYSLIFDRSSNAWFAGGIGVWTTPAPIVARRTAWSANSLGIEQLVVNQIISPPGGAPIAAVWDRGFFLQKNPDAFPSTYWDNSASQHPIMSGWNIDYCSNDPTCIVGWETSNISPSTAPAWSSDGGNTFTLFASKPTHPGAQGGNIAALTSQKWALIAALGQPISYTTDGGRTWAISRISGTPTNWLTGSGVGQALGADRVAPDTYCAVTTSKTFFSSTNAGASFTASNSALAKVDGFPNQSFLLSVPGRAGHFYYTAGGQQGMHPAPSHLWKSTNACATWTAVDPGHLGEPILIGFGAAAPTGTYPTIYVYGYYNRVLGFYQSTDGGTTWTVIKVPASQTPWPLNSADLATWLSGDANVYGRIYIGFRGSGAAYIDTADACPWVGFTNIDPNSSLTGTVILTAHHSGLIPVSSVQFSVDGSNIGSPLTGGGPYSASWDTGSLARGAHTLKVAATGVNCTGSFSIPITTH